MKRTLIMALAILSSLFGFAKGPQVTKIEPANWFAGMKNPSVQLMVYGKDIRNADVTVDYAGVKIDSLVRLDSPNYLFVYLNTQGAQPGIMNLTFTTPSLHNGRAGVGLKAKKVVKYELKQREMSGDKRMGFTKADVLYMLMPDRFAQGNPANTKVKTRYPYAVDRKAPSLRHGGDIAGLRQHLDYFTDLGVTALWVTPVLENDCPDNDGASTYHGYATTDYYRIDPRFGSNDEYKAFIDDCHKKGLKVVMDMIFNHCGLEHPWLANNDFPAKDWFNNSEWLLHPKTKPVEATPGQATTYNGGLNEWFRQTNYKLTTTVDPYASNHDLDATVDGWFVPSMPDLNQRNPHLMKYLIQNSEWWIETVGIDGIRMDTYPYANAEGMSHWMAELNNEYPNYNVVGESWVVEPAFTAALQKDSKITPVPRELAKKGVKSFNTNLKTVMDFTFFAAINDAKWKETDDWDWGFNKVYSDFVYDYLYPNPGSVLAFIENHDTDRYLRTEDMKDAMAKLQQAYAVLLTMNRIPQLYYGTEIMMAGNKDVTDGNVRKDFPGGFPGDTRSAFTAEGRTAQENAMYNWTKTLLHWRQGNDVIIKGTQKQYCPKGGIYVMTHEYNGKHVMLILNGTDKEATYVASRFAEDVPAGAKAVDIFTKKAVNIAADFKVAPRGTVLVEY